MDCIFSGVQPTGNLHIGNYLGAIQNFVQIQKRENISKSYYCVVDLHAITVWQNPDQLKKDTLETAASFLAAGVDPEKSIIFNQSRVSTHAELACIIVETIETNSTCIKEVPITTCVDIPRI